jgi:hypothetical protein
MIVASPTHQIKSSAYLRLFIRMLFILTLCFKVNPLIMFYYSFEVALLPIFLIIIG